MSLRLSESAVQGAQPAPLLKRHPKTGALLEPLGSTKRGRLIWPILGASPDDDTDDAGGNDQDADNGDDDGDDSSEDDSDDSDDKEGKKSDKPVSKADYDALHRRMVAADKRASSLEAEKKKADDAKKDDLTKANDKVKDLEASASEKDETIGGLRLEVAFLSSNTHHWHESDLALETAQNKGYLENVIDEDGTIDRPALKKALDKLAKDKPFLLGKSGQDDDDDDSDSGSGSGSSGGNVGRGNSRDGIKATEARARSKFRI